MIFQGKSKKPKKGKMYKVDNRILGFSVTAAPDRINVGDRDYGEGVELNLTTLTILRKLCNAWPNTWFVIYLL